MDSDTIRKLGADVYARPFTPLKRTRTSKAAVVGFDTEYDSTTGRLVSFQLSHRGATRFQPCSRLTPELLADAAVALIGGRPPRVELACYWSLAELQHLPVWLEGFQYREYAGSFECDFDVGPVLLSIYDAARWYASPQHSLAEAAESIGERKLEWDRTRVTARDCKSERFRQYAVHDAYLAERLVNELRRAWLDRGVDILVYRTPAGAAAAAYRRTMAEPVLPPPSRCRAVALAGCWGGRAEAFYRGDAEGVRELDIVSAYPSALRDLERLPRSGDWRCSRDVPRRALGGYVRGRFRFPAGHRWPCLPVSHAGTLLYPLAGDTTCTVDEWRLAAELGAELDVWEAWTYSDGDPSLPSFMGERIRDREREQGISRYVSKLQANAMIGKLAQRNRRPGLELLRRAAADLDVGLDLLVQLTHEEQAIVCPTDNERPSGSWWPEVNGLVTGRTRATLSRMIAEGGALYCATDAVWTTRKGKPPAGWSVKREGNAAVFRTRVARLGPHVVFHGWASRKAAADAMDGGPVTYTIRRPVKPRESLRRNRRLGTFREEQRTGSLAWCDKRQLLPSGLTLPWPDVGAYDAAHARRPARGPSAV